MTNCSVLRPISPPPIMPPRRASLAPSKRPKSRFGKGYGDFTMESSDNMLLYFPKDLLIQASPFFKDMFGIAEHATNSSLVDNTQPLVMEEDSETLEDLLLCIDPSKAMPPINPSTIEKVFRAAHKYQIEKFITYFAYVVGQEPACTCAAQNCGEFLSKNAALVLSLAERYDLPDLARRALRRLIVEPMDKLLASNPAISLKMWLHLLHLRKQRTGWFVEYIDRIGRGRHSGVQICHRCHTCLMAWTRNVHDTPSWSSVEKEISTWLENCTSPYFSVINTTDHLKMWKTEVREVERHLPALP
jgi:BTB/POZ domain